MLSCKEFKLLSWFLKKLANGIRGFPAQNWLKCVSKRGQKRLRTQDSGKRYGFYT